LAIFWLCDFKGHLPPSASTKLEVPNPIDSQNRPKQPDSTDFPASISASEAAPQTFTSALGQLRLVQKSIRLGMTCIDSAWLS